MQPSNTLAPSPNSSEAFVKSFEEHMSYVRNLEQQVEESRSEISSLKFKLVVANKTIGYIVQEMSDKSEKRGRAEGRAEGKAKAKWMEEGEKIGREKERAELMKERQRERQ
jgi:hypothetical protein